MKRWLIRLSVLSVAGILGFFAITWAQQSSADPAIDSNDRAVTDNIALAAGKSAAPAQASTPNAEREESAIRVASSGTAAGTRTQAPRPTESSPPQFRLPPGTNANNGTGTTVAAPAARVSAAQRRDPFGLSAKAETPAPRATTPPAGSRVTVPVEPQRLAAAAPPVDRFAIPTKSTSRQSAPEGSRLTAAPAAQPAYGDTIPRYDNTARTRPVPRDPGPAPARLADRTAAVEGLPRNESPAGRFASANSTLPDARSINSRPRFDGAAPAVSGTGRPGGRQLEGPQGPNLILEKIAPDEIQVGKSTTFDIKVFNPGTVTAHDVRIHDVVPQGTRLLGTKPKAQSTGGGGLVWSIGNLEPGDEKFVEVQLMPETEGEIGSVASVTFSTKASSRSLATKPKLKIDVDAPPQVMIGDQITLRMTVANLGTGAARDVVLFESIPSQFRHPSGAELEFDIGDLDPRETREIELTLTAARPGVVDNILSARGDGSLTADASVQIEVIAPALAVTVTGPTRRYLEREATHTLLLENPGTAPAKQIELVSHLPRALKFVSANNAGHYDQKTHAVYWSLEELPEGEQGNVTLVTLPTEPGDHTMRVETTASQDLADSSEGTIHVEGLAALFFEVVDVADPVEVGGDTTYEIRVLNQGTKTASNIVVAALIPPGMRPLSADGPTNNDIQGGQVIFEPLPRLAPKADATYSVRVQGVQPGDQRVKIQIQSDELRQPVTKEESTRVYSDR